jgi:catechol 2,3-dioxygenase-like lactoylglutathione lyase family enzyme
MRLPVILHHLSFGTNDVERARGFYDPVLAVVGLRLIMENAHGAHYGVSTIFFSLNVPIDGRPATAGNGAHICFAAEDRAMVDAFYRVALAHGGTSDGAPGIRSEYDAHYYGAFVRDPDGNKVEAVTYSAE